MIKKIVLLLICLIIILRLTYYYFNYSTKSLVLDVPSKKYYKLLAIVLTIVLLLYKLANKLVVKKDVIVKVPVKVESILTKIQLLSFLTMIFTGILFFRRSSPNYLIKKDLERIKCSDSIDTSVLSQILISEYYSQNDLDTMSETTYKDIMHRFKQQVNIALYGNASPLKKQIKDLIDCIVEYELYILKWQIQIPDSESLEDKAGYNMFYFMNVFYFERELLKARAYIDLKYLQDSFNPKSEKLPLVLNDATPQPCALLHPKFKLLELTKDEVSKVREKFIEKEYNVFWLEEGI